MEEFLTPKELAELLGISERTLYRWHERRVGPPRVKCGNFIGYRTKAFNKWLKDNETQPVGG